MANTDPLVTFIQSHPLTQDERESIIILMLIIMYADKKLTLEENSTLRHYEKMMKWESDRSLSDFFSNRISEIRSVMRDEARLSTYIENTCARIVHDNIKGFVMKACNDMAAADAFKDKEEAFLLEAIVNTLEVQIGK
jgi:uncharacterized tellurite resistance protein B-like protein